MRNPGWTALLSLLLGASPSALAQESLADRFPSDAIVYVEVDTHRLVDGALSLDLVKLLDEAQVQEFLKPLAGQLPAPISTQGLRQLIDSVPWRSFVDGRIEIALRGVHVEFGDQTFDVSPAHPIDARQLNRLLGLAARHATSDEENAPAIQVSTDVVARIDAGDAFDGWFHEMLGHLDSMGVEHQVESEKLAGRDATRIKIAIGGGDAPTQWFHVVRDGKRWWIGGSAATLERCLKGGGQDSLARSRAFQNFRAQVSGGDPAVLAYVNVANASRIFERLMAPIVKEELDLLGLSEVEAFGMASTFVAGGVRDSLALTFAAPPKGFLGLLDCTEGGFEFLRKAPLETGFYVGARLDAEAFVDRLATVTEDLFPGTGSSLEKALAEASREIGMDVRQELLPAFGDELGVYLTAPGAGSVIPEGMLMIKVGDRDQFEKVLARALSEARQHGVQANEIKSMPDGCKGWTIVASGAPVQPAIALTNDLFCVSINVISLKKSLREIQGGLEKCACDNENLQRVLQGLTGSNSANGLSLLGFVDLRRLVEFGYQFVPMAAAQFGSSGDLPLDLASMPEPEVVASHFTGIGFAGRSDEKGLSLAFFTPTGLLTQGALAIPWLADRHHAQVTAMEPVEVQVDDEVPGPTPPTAARRGTVRSLAELFANLEKATGATIDYPAELADVEVAYTARSADLETILRELSDLAGFSFTVRDVDGEKLVVVSHG